METRAAPEPAPIKPEEETKTVTEEVAEDAEDKAQKLGLNCCGVGL